MMENDPQYKYLYLNTLLIPLIGAQNTEDWWNTGNKAFGGLPPISIYETRFKDIKQYLLAQYGGEYL